MAQRIFYFHLVKKTLTVLGQSTKKSRHLPLITLFVPYQTSILTRHQLADVLQNKCSQKLYTGKHVLESHVSLIHVKYQFLIVSEYQ